jgi:predicted enzyme related to lactoylglutathione lyase
VTGHVSAVGIGVSNLDSARRFYGTFGYITCIRASFEPWSEDICAGSPSFIPMKFKSTLDNPLRSVKNLPVKLTFSCPNPKLLQERIAKISGSIVTDLSAESTGAKVGTLYAKDPDGYLFELVPGRGSISLTGVGYGSSNMSSAATFFSSLFATTPKQPQKLGAWDMVTVPTKRAFSVHFLDFHDERPTKRLPLKIVIAVPNIAGFKKTIQDGGGTIPKGGDSALGGAAAFGQDSVNQILIEINRG